MQFNLNLSGLGAAVSESLGSMSPIFYIVAGLVIGAGVLAWGIDMLQSWRADQDYDEYSDSVGRINEAIASGQPIPDDIPEQHLRDWYQYETSAADEE